MRRLRDFFCLLAPLAGLEDILDRVADGRLARDDAARQIRKLAAKPHIPPWAPRLVRIIGALCVVVGIALVAYNFVSSIGAEETQGTVIEMVGCNTYSSIVEYNVGGKRFTCQSSWSSRPPAYFVGEKVSVLYRPDNPGNARLNSFHDRWMFPVMFLCGGIWTVILGFFLTKIFNAITSTE